MIRQLAAEAGSLYTAKWEPRIGPNHAIDETAAGLNLARDFFRVFGVSLLQMLEPSPKRVSLAIWIASSSFAAGITAATGPNNSSL